MAILTKALPIIFNTVYTTPRRILISSILDAAGGSLKKRELLYDVINYVLLAHSGQYRKGDKFKNPNNDEENIKYLTHQYMVFIQGYLEGIPFEQQIALLLHDTIEDGTKYFHPDFNKTRAIIRKDIAVICDQYGDGFGGAVLSRINYLTNKAGLKPHEKKAWQLDRFENMPTIDQNNKLRDKLANMWDTFHNAPDCWSDEKKADDLAFAFDLLAVANDPPQYIEDLLLFLSNQ